MHRMSVPTITKVLEKSWLTRNPLACALWPVSALYGAVTGLRRRLYALRWVCRHAPAVPVIVVGNLITGGAGKTPTVMAVVAALRRHGYTPGIVSRGFGAATAGVGPINVTRQTPVQHSGDEPLLMHLRTGAPVVVGRQRAAAARQLLAWHPQVNVIVSDDGLQHLALKRDAQVLVFDERGAGNGWLLPAGPLRESLPTQVPARSLVLYNATAASTSLPGALVQRSIQGVVALADWWQGAPASTALLDKIRHTPVVAAAGLAQPERFFHMMKNLRVNIIPLPLPDHHPYTTLPWPAGTPHVVVTEKDAIKLDPLRADLGATCVWVAPLNLTFDAAFERALLGLITPLKAP
jgi:tetraacyldisaccharide 4'-kinase